MPSRLRNLPLAALLSVVVIWASAFVAIRGLGDTFTPGPMALGRLIVGAIALGIVALPKARPLPRGRPLWLILGFGVAWFAAYNVALNAAETSLDAGTAALIVNIGPILIAVFAGLLLGEGFPRTLIIGSVVAFGGVALIALGGRDGGAGGSTSTGGVLLCVLAAVLYAAGVLFQKPALRSVPAIQATWLGCTVGAIACLPYAPGLVDEIGGASTADIGWLIYLGVFPTALGFVLFAYALTTLSAGTVSATTYLVPAVATLISWTVLDETPSAIAFVGGALCLIGVAITRVKRRPPVTTAAETRRAY